MISRILQLLSSSIFARESSQPKFLQLSLVTILFMFGAYYWLYLLNYGFISFNAYDWHQFSSYDKILKDALTQANIPYYISRLYQGTNQFLGLPETNLMPTVFLLNFLSIQEYQVCNFILMFGIGFLGCLLIKKQFDLSFLAFTVLFLLFNFNGYITSHLLVGHIPWFGYYLLPFVILNVLTEIEGKNPHFIRNVSLALFMMLLLGGLHIFVITAMFLVLWTVFNIRFFSKVSQAIIWSLLLAIFRFIPAGITFWHKDHTCCFGFPDLLKLVGSFFIAYPHDYFQWSGPFWHEYNYFIGILGFIFIVYFGIIKRFVNPKQLYNFSEFDGPLLVISFLALSNYYSFITKLPIPLIEVERLPSRFIMIPLVVLTILASIRLQDVLDKVSMFKIKFLWILAFLYGAHEILAQAGRWNLDILQNHHHFINAVIIRPEIISIPDQSSLYINAVNISAGISLIFLVIWIKTFLFNKKGVLIT